MRSKTRLLSLLSALALIVSWELALASPVLAQARTMVDPKDGLTYVWIPPGTFQMGCSPGDVDCLPSERPAHSVTLTKGFWIGQTPVTQAAFIKAMGYNPSHFVDTASPVDAVSWYDARDYCQRAGMRLPTEAEWEYAARGGTTTARYGPLDQIAWYSANGGGKTHEVAQKQPNGYGLYDMLGNLWEWVADWPGPYDSAGAVDPKTTQKTGDDPNDQIVRGGSWLSKPSMVRVSERGRYVQGVIDSVGIRCVGN